MRYKYGIINQILKLTYFGLILFFNCSQKTNFTDSHSIAGFWQSSTVDDWKFVYEIKLDSLGYYQGKVHSFWYDCKEIETTLQDIRYQHPDLQFISNPEANINR